VCVRTIKWTTSIGIIVKNRDRWPMATSKSSREKEIKISLKAKDTKQTRDTRSMSVVARELADPKPHD
jgi:hypothetical protein